MSSDTQESMSYDSWGMLCFDNDQLINRENADYYTLVAAVVSIIIFSLLSGRKCHYKKNKRCYDYFGPVNPARLLHETSNRGLYIAAFCLTAWSLFNVMGDKTPFTWKKSIPTQIHLIADLVIGILVALQFYPIMASLQCKTVLGYTIGCIYCWFCGSMFIVKEFPCTNTKPLTLTLSVARRLPVCIPLLYLSVWFPIATLKAAWNSLNKYDAASYDLDKKSGQYIYVKHIMQKSAASPKFPKDRTISKVMLFILEKLRGQFRRIYSNTPGFRFSLSVLVAAVLSCLILFMVTTELLHGWFRIIEYMKEMATDLEPMFNETTFDNSSSFPATGNEQLNLLAFAYYLELTLRVCFAYEDVVNAVFVSILGIAYLFGNLSVLLMLRNYKRDSQLVYKGKSSNTFKKISHRPAKVVVKASRFPGYQIAWAVSGMVFTMCILIIVLIIISAVFFIIRQSWAKHVASWIATVVPAIIVVWVVGNSQYWLFERFFVVTKPSKTKKFKSLELKNIIAFNNYQYFVLFFEVSIGLFSSFGTFFRSVALSFWITPRVDLCIFPRTFEKYNSGFMSYCSMLTLENCYRNPVMLCFCQLLENSMQQKRSSPKSYQMNHRNYKFAKKWQLLITLRNNPKLIAFRKREID